MAATAVLLERAGRIRAYFCRWLRCSPLTTAATRLSDKPNNPHPKHYLTKQEAVELDEMLFSDYSVDQLMEIAGLSVAQVSTPSPSRATYGKG